MAIHYLDSTLDIKLSLIFYEFHINTYSYMFIINKVYIVIIEIYIYFLGFYFSHNLNFYTLQLFTSVHIRNIFKIPYVIQCIPTYTSLYTLSNILSIKES